MTSVALIPRPPLGDGLLYLVMAWSLHRAGYVVTVIHDQLAQLADWAPGLQLRTRAESAAGATYDFVVHHDGESRAWVRGMQQEWVAREHPSTLHRHAHRSEVLAELVQGWFGLDAVEPNYELFAPDELHWHGASRSRVLLHPEAGEPARTWGRGRFLELARRLRADGREVVFVMTPAESSRWRGDCERQGFAILARPNLSGLAESMLSAQALVGNDSGVGHLAAAVGLPAVILFTRRRVAERWCPRGRRSPVVPVLPGFEVPIVGLQRRLWKHSIPVNAVHRALQGLFPSVLDEF